MHTRPPQRQVSSQRRPAFFFFFTFYFLLFTSFLTGCGYTTAELYPDQHRTVAVPLFENRTFYRGVEADLGEALTKELEQRTPYRLGRGGEADTELTGVVQRVSQRRLSRTADAGLPQEVEVSVVIDFVWRDSRTSEVLAERRGLEQVGRFVPARGTAATGEPFEAAQHAAIARLADDIVSAMRNDF